MKFAFIDGKKDEVPVSFMCRHLGVSRAGFYAWRSRPRSEHSERDEELGELIEAKFTELRGTAGAPRVVDELRKDGERTSKKRVARLMRTKGLSAKAPKAFVCTTDSSHGLPVAENLLGRNFSVAAPNRVYVSDITYIRTWEGWLYLAVVLDLFSRRVVGFAIDDHMRAELAVDALSMVIRERRPEPGAIFHSDRGVQFASEALQGVLRTAEMKCSMSRKGDCWDNAVAESFFSTLKRELIYRHAWPTKLRAKAAVEEYITCFYNPRRPHTSLSNESPIGYELAHRGSMAA